MTEEASGSVAQRFGLKSDSPTFLLALTHPSYAHEQGEPGDNQRLEFLGDAILDFCISEFLFQRFADADEGVLTRTRAQLVSAKALAAFGRKIGVSGALRLGRGARSDGLQESTNVVADAVEALIAAAYLDHGLEPARAICIDVAEFGLSRQARAGGRDPKSELQERVQARGHQPPSYRVLSREGPAHDTLFEVEVQVGARIVGRGRGRSRRAAEQSAATEALQARAYELDPAGSGSEEDARK